MADLPVWGPDLAHECCGPPRHVGEAMQLQLTFAANTVPNAGPDCVEVQDNGRVSVVGEVVGAAGLMERDLCWGDVLGMHGAPTSQHGIVLS